MDTGQTAAIMDVVVGLRTPHSAARPMVRHNWDGQGRRGSWDACRRGGVCAEEAGHMQKRWGACRRGGVHAEKAGCMQKGRVHAEEAGHVLNAFMRVLKRPAMSWERESDVPVFNGVSIGIEPAGLIL